jgi:hypothetical protein
MLKKAAGCVLAGHCRLTGDTARSPSRGRPQTCPALFGMAWTSAAFTSLQCFIGAA